MKIKINEAKKQRSKKLKNTIYPFLTIDDSQVETFHRCLQYHKYIAQDASGNIYGFNYKPRYSFVSRTWTNSYRYSLIASFPSNYKTSQYSLHLVKRDYMRDDESDANLPYVELVRVPTGHVGDPVMKVESKKVETIHRKKLNANKNKGSTSKSRKHNSKRNN